jgi:hypothetical protein
VGGGPASIGIGEEASIEMRPAAPPPDASMVDEEPPTPPDEGPDPPLAVPPAVVDPPFPVDDESVLVPVEADPPEPPTVTALPVSPIAPPEQPSVIGESSAQPTRPKRRSRSFRIIKHLWSKSLSAAANSIKNRRLAQAKAEASTHCKSTSAIGRTLLGAAAELPGASTAPLDLSALPPFPNREPVPFGLEEHRSMHERPLRTSSPIAAGEIAIFEPSEKSIDFVAQGNTGFVLGSAGKHPVDVRQIDLERDWALVLERVMTRGTWEAMKGLRYRYPAEVLADFIRTRGRRLLAPHPTNG